MDDKNIVELYFQRNEKAIHETSIKYGKYCYSIATGILNNNEDAEECVNDTYNQAWHCIPPHRPSNLAIFLGKITRRVSIDKLRYRSANKRGNGEIALVLDELQDCISSDASLEQEYEQRRLSAVMNFFVNSLPKTEQKVFICRYWYTDSIESICKQFGFSESKVKSMLHRTRKKLQIILEREGFK